MPDTRARKVTIFVSSPIDVAPERGCVQAVTAKLNREYEGLVRFWLSPHAKRETLSVGDRLRAADSSRGLEGQRRAGRLCVPQDCRCDFADGGRGAPPPGADPGRRA